MVFDHLLHASAIFVLGFVGVLALITAIAFVLLLRPSTGDRHFPFVLLDVSLGLSLALVLFPLFLLIRLVLIVVAATNLRASGSHRPGDYPVIGRFLNVAVDTSTGLSALLHLCMLDRLPGVFLVMTGDLTLRQALTPSSRGHENDRVECISNFTAVVAVAAACWTLFVALDASSFRSTVSLTLHSAAGTAVAVYAATRTSASTSDFVLTVLRSARESPFFLLFLVMPLAWLVTLLSLACGRYLKRRMDTVVEAALVAIPMFWCLLLFLGGLLSSVASVLGNVGR